MYVGILFSLSMLVHLVRPCSMHVGIFFGLGTLVRLLQPRSYVCWYFFQPWYVSTLSTAMFSCMLVFFSVLVC